MLLRIFRLILRPRHRIPQKAKILPTVPVYKRFQPLRPGQVIRWGFLVLPRAAADIVVAAIYLPAALASPAGAMQHRADMSRNRQARAEASTSTTYLPTSTPKSSSCH